jgi:hypothetical protein
MFRAAGQHVLPNGSCSERRHFLVSGICVAPNDGISAAEEFVLLRTTAFPLLRNSRRSERQRKLQQRIEFAPTFHK